MAIWQGYFERDQWLMWHKAVISSLVMRWRYHSLVLNHWDALELDLCCINSLWAREPIFLPRSGSALAQIMACCLTAPSHYLNQCWLIICRAMCHSPTGNSTENVHESNHAFENYTFNSLRPSDAIWQHRSGSTSAQVMACCLTAPSHYLNQCWLIISKV